MRNSKILAAGLSVTNDFPMPVRSRRINHSWSWAVTIAILLSAMALISWVSSEKELVGMINLDHQRQLQDFVEDISRQNNQVKLFYNDKQLTGANLVYIRQGLIGRIFNVGWIEINPASEEAKEIIKLNTSKNELILFNGST